MKNKRYWLAILLTLPVVGLFIAAREAASWRLQFVGVPQTYVYQCEVSPDGRYVAIEGDHIALFDLKTNRETILSRKGLGVSGEVRFSGDGRYLAWCEWRRPAGNSQKIYYRHREDVIVVWDMTKQKPARTVPISFTYEGAVASQIAFNATNVLVFRRGTKLVHVPPHASHITEHKLDFPVQTKSLQLSYDGLQLIGLDKNNPFVFHIFDASSLKPLGRVTTPVASKAGTRASKIPQHNLYAIFDGVANLNQIYALNSARPIWGVTLAPWFYSRDGNTLVSFTSSHFQLRNSTNGAVTRSSTPLGLEGSYHTFSFEPDGSHLLFFEGQGSTMTGRFLRQRIR